MICIFVYERDAARRLCHLRVMHRFDDWPAALALLAVVTSEHPHVCFEVEAYPDAPGDADGE